MKKHKNKLYYIAVLVIIMIMAFGGCKKDTKLKSEEDNITSLASDKAASDDREQTDKESDKEPDKEPNNEKEAGDESASPAPEAIEYAMHIGSVEVKEEIIYEDDFEGETTQFTGRGAARVEIIGDKAKDGSKSLFVSGRTALWNGATVDLSDKLINGEKYVVNGWVYYEQGPKQVQFDCKVERNSSQYLSFASALAKKGEWTYIEGSITIPQDTISASVYFETGYADGENIDFCVDEVTIKQETATVDRGDIPSLKEVYKDLFSMGVAVTASEIPPIRQELIKQQFNSLTPGNELKPDSVLDHATSKSDPKYDENPAVNFDRAKPILDFAKEANIPVRGHTLVWHSQTPRWFFTEGYSTAADAPLVSKELMLKRLENYIRQVLEYTQTNYPGLIYAWDVVNEAINPGEGDENGFRVKDSLWYEVIGPEFVEKAFEFARKYADPEVKLFYNDYNTEENGRMLYMKRLVKGLKEKGLIDGIGLQSHLRVDGPSLVDVNTSFMEYGKLGLEIHITELDMGLKDNSEEAIFDQAKKYKRLFMFIKNVCETGLADITNVTFWGLSDDISWLNKPSEPNYPLIFDNYLLQKPAFWGVVLSPDIPLF